MCCLDVFVCFVCDMCCATSYGVCLLCVCLVALCVRCGLIRVCDLLVVDCVGLCAL